MDTVLTYLAQLVRKARGTSPTAPKSVLLKSFGVIGDYVLLSASFEGYRRLFPEHRIVLLVRKDVHELAIHNPYIDDIILVDYWSIRRNPFKKVKLWLSLLHYDFTAVVNLDYSTHYESRDRAVLGWASAEKNIGHQCLDNSAHRDYGRYTDVILHTKKWVFEIERNNEMVRQLGIPSYNTMTTRIFGIDSYELRPEIKKLIPPTNYFVVCPGSGSPKNSKCWQPDKFAAIIKKMQQVGYTAILCGSRSETGIAKNILLNLPASNVLDLTGRTRLMELAFIMKNACMVISNDSSPAHIAAAVSTQAIVIIGGGQYGRFYPYPDRQYIHPIIHEGMDCFYCNWECKYDHYKCIKDISVETVENEMMKLIHLGIIRS